MIGYGHMESKTEKLDCKYMQPLKDLYKLALTVVESNLT